MALLTGKKALITGGSSGIGLAIAKEFIAQGATVLITGRNKSTLESAQASLGSAALIAVADIALASDHKVLAERIRNEFGNLDIIVSNAGTIALNPTLEVSETEYNQIFDTNVRGTFLTMQHCIPLLNHGATVVLISSIAHFKVLPGHTVYAASKAAVRALARGWADELKHQQIRVNCLSPGPVKTPILHKLGVSAEQLPAVEQQLAGQIPLARMGDPEEIARATLFLAGPDSSFITGVDLCVDGGMSQL